MKFWVERLVSKCTSWNICCSMTHPNFVPDIIVCFQHGEMMLYWYDKTMTRNKLIVRSTRQIYASAHRGNRRLRWRIVFAIAECTLCEDFLCLLVV